MNVEIGAEAALFPEKEYISGIFVAVYTSERFIYFLDQSAYSAAGKYVDRSWEYKSLTCRHISRNWYRSRAIP
jgi:hypothetical protein